MNVILEPSGTAASAPPTGGGPAVLLAGRGGQPQKMSAVADRRGTLDTRGIRLYSSRPGRPEERE